jgi:hypothetical protein
MPGFVCDNRGEKVCKDDTEIFVMIVRSDLWRLKKGNEEIKYVFDHSWLLNKSNPLRQLE